jgi:hypothetical protein
LTRAATAETEEEMLELAHNATAAQLERAVRAYRSAIAVAENRPPPNTFFAWDWDDDGTLSVRGRLPADQGALLIEAMHHGRQLIYADSRSAVTVDGEPAGPPPTNVDAVATVCEAALSSTGTSTGATGIRSCSTSTAAVAASSRRDPRSPSRRPVGCSATRRS